MKGYGVRNITTKEPVDENTLFMIASNSKLFTATSLAFGIFPLKFKTEGSKVISVEIKASDFVEYDPYTFTKQ